MKLFNVMVAVSLCVFTVTTASAQNRFLRAERKAPGDTYIVVLDRSLPAAQVRPAA